MRPGLPRFPQRRSVRLAASILFVLTTRLQPAASAQTEVSSGGVLRVTSRLVTLDVTVLDAKGNTVTDLKQSDFTVYENGQPQSIRNFDGFNTHALTPTLTATSINNAADLERVAPNAPVTILVLDEFNTDFSDNAYARLQLKKYLLAQPAVLKQPTTFVAATDAGFQQIQNYTLDRQRLIDGLAHLPAVLPGTLLRTQGQPEGLAIRFAQTLDSLQQIAEASIGHKGRKNIIWVGRGFTSIDLQNEPAHQVDLIQHAAERTVNLLREAHVTVYSVDPTLSTKLVADIDDTATTVDAAAFAAETHDPTDPFDGTVSFNTIAPLSGGRAFSMFNDLDQEIATSVTEGSAYYSIAYVPTAEIDADHPHRRIDVKLDRPGLTVITRHGYYSVTPPPPALSSHQELKSEGYDIGSALGSGITYTGLALSAAVSSSNPTECIVQVATRNIQWDTQPDGTTSAHLTLVAVAFDAHNKPLGNPSKKDIVARLKDISKLEQLPFATLTVNIPQQKNAKSIRIAVRDVATGKLGTAELDLSPEH